MDLVPSAERAPKRVNAQGKHLWQALRRRAYRQTPTRPLTAFGKACGALWPWSVHEYPGIRDGLLATMQSRAAWQSIIDWRYGRRRAPAWAIALVSLAIDRRIAELQHAKAILEKEKAPD